MATRDEALANNSPATAAASVATPAQALALAATAEAPVAAAGTARAEKKRRARGRNFQAHEDLRLCATWLRVCTTTTSGASKEQDDSASSFWERACVIFNGDGSVHPGDASFRSYQALQSRWSALQKTIATFGEVYDHVRQELVEKSNGPSASGSANRDADQVDTSGSDVTQTASANATSELTREEEEELLKQAQSRYAERHRMRSQFTLLPCWELLRETPTWQKYVTRSGRGNVRPNSRVVSLSTVSKKDGKSSGDGGELADGETAKSFESASSKKRRAVDVPGVTHEGNSVAETVAPTNKQSKRAATESEDVAAEMMTVNKEPITSLALPSPTPASVIKGGGFLSVFSPPTAFAANEDDQFLQWSVRENRALPAGANGGDADTRSFALFDDNKRIETLVGGLYELNLYLEPQGNDASKYFLEINGNALTASQESASSSGSGGGSRRSSLHPVAQASTDAADDEEAGIPFKNANVAQMQLNKWDMIALRRKVGTSSNSTGGKTPFARFIIEFVRNV